MPCPALPLAPPLAPPNDALAAATHPDPTAYYAQLAAAHGLHRDEAAGRWIAASAAAVHAALLHPALRVRPPQAPVPPALRDSPLGSLFARLLRMTDGSAHAALRRVLAPALAELPGAAVAALGERCARALLPTPPQRGEEVTAFALALPVHAVAQLLGLAPAALPEAVRCTEQLARALSPLATAPERAHGAAALGTLEAALAQARGGPLLEALQRPSDLDAPTLRANAVGLLVQTCEATAGLIGNALVALGRDAAHLPRLRAAPEALEALLTQVLQQDAPVQNTRRYAAEDLSLLGTRLRAGDEVLLLLAAANRDRAAAALAPAPGCPHFTFGLGAHACPGAPLALALAGAAVRRLLALGVAPELLARDVRYRPSLNGRVPAFRGACLAAEVQP